MEGVWGLSSLMLGGEGVWGLHHKSIHTKILKNFTKKLFLSYINKKKFGSFIEMYYLCTHEYKISL